MYFGFKWNTEGWSCACLAFQRQINLSKSQIIPSTNFNIYVILHVALVFHLMLKYANHGTQEQWGYAHDTEPWIPRQWQATKQYLNWDFLNSRQIKYDKSRQLSQFDYYGYCGLKFLQFPTCKVSSYLQSVLIYCLTCKTTRKAYNFIYLSIKCVKRHCEEKYSLEGSSRDCWMLCWIYITSTVSLLG